MLLGYSMRGMLQRTQVVSSVATVRTLTGASQQVVGPYHAFSLRATPNGGCVRHVENQLSVCDVDWSSIAAV